jgi:hypothetical protein
MKISDTFFDLPRSSAMVGGHVVFDFEVRGVLKMEGKNYASPVAILSTIDVESPRRLRAHQ